MEKKTHCKRGHEYTDETVYVTKRNTRVCRPCRGARRREKRGEVPSMTADPRQMTIDERIAAEMAKVMMDESDAEIMRALDPVVLVTSEDGVVFDGEILRGLAELTSADDSWPPATVVTTAQQRDLLIAAGCTADIEVPSDEETSC